MKARRLMPLFFFLAPAVFWPAGAAEASGHHTEAGFSFECPDCGRDSDQMAKSFKLAECLGKALSKECQEVPKKHRMACGGKAGSFADYTAAAGGSFLSCGEYLLDSAEFLLEIIWGALKFSAGLALDSEAREGAAGYLLSAKNYLAIEFFKAYREEKGGKAERLLKAAASLAGDSFDSMMAWVKNFVQRQYSSFMCYSGAAQTAIICSVAASLAIPLPGGSLFSAISAGLKTGRISAEAAKAAKKAAGASMSALNKGKAVRLKGGSLSGKKLKALSSRIYQDASQRIRAASKNMPRSVQREVSRLFAESGSAAMRARLEGALKAAAKRKNISAAALAAAAAGALIPYRVFLSKETSALVAKEVSDQMSTAYVMELIEKEAEKKPLDEFSSAMP